MSLGVYKLALPALYLHQLSELIGPCGYNIYWPHLKQHETMKLKN